MTCAWPEHGEGLRVHSADDQQHVNAQEPIGLVARQAPSLMAVGAVHAAIVPRSWPFTRQQPVRKTRGICWARRRRHIPSHPSSTPR